MKTENMNYTGENLTHVAFPLGGIGAGMFCLEGVGSLAKFSIRNKPDTRLDPMMFSALCVKKDDENVARIIEGQVPYYKIFGGTGESFSSPGNGLHGRTYGLPRFSENDFTAKFPFATLNFKDELVPLDVSLTGFSPFIPLEDDNSSNPVASLEYTFQNNTNEAVEAVYYISAVNFMNVGVYHGSIDIKDDVYVYPKDNGFVLNQPALKNKPSAQGDFYVAIEDEDATVNTDWFNGAWFDVLTMQWNDIKAGDVKGSHEKNNKSPGGSIAVPFTLNPLEKKKIIVKFAWYVPNTDFRSGYDAPSKKSDCGCSCGSDCCKPEIAPEDTYKPWYSKQYKNVEEVMNFFCKNYDSLYEKSLLFSNALHNIDMPKVLTDAIASNLVILKSPTVLRQDNGRIWAWEGCCDTDGCCHGSCTHVWNYAQAMPHLFPNLEKSLRATEFNENQNDIGHQQFRASMPIRETENHFTNEYFHAASDGQLGGIMKMYREWRIGADDNFIKEYYNKMVQSIEYCITTWDKKEEGVLKEPHHNTYDIEFWGADGMCSSFYLGALKAMTIMGKAFDKDVTRYETLYQRGKEYLETKLFNGEYFYQEVEWKTLEARVDFSNENEQATQLVTKQGPKYQYGKGCISDGVLGAWLAKMCGLGEILDPEKVKSHLLSVYKYNFKKSLKTHENPQRPGYAVGNEGGLLLCSWPHGDKPSLPFVYSDEVWTGIEHQVASHLISYGFLKEGLDIVSASRERYDGTKRNPFNEYECGHWYARAMASYGYIQAYTGVRYDAKDSTLYIDNKNSTEFSAFICTSTGFGNVFVNGNDVTLTVSYGEIHVNDVVFI